jgi:hypothetical protein
MYGRIILKLIVKKKRDGRVLTELMWLRDGASGNFL